MAGFLEGYETVNQKVQRLHATYPTNRIETSIIDWSPEKGYILIECRIYRRYEDEKPAAVDYAYGMVSAYNVQMKRWYVEDTVSSAIGRCASVVLGTETKPSRENMEQVEELPKAFIEADPWSKPIWEEGFETAKSAVEQIAEQLGGVIEREAPICKHGHMLLKEGTSPKTGKDYKGHVCSAKSKSEQCPPKWYVQNPDGTFQDKI